MKKRYKHFDIEIPKTVKTILVSFSGGTDSLLTLYSICDYIKTYNLDIKVYCVHGLDHKDCPESLHNVEDMLQKLKKIFLMDLPMHIFEYEGVEHKRQIHAENISRIIQENNYNMIVYGSSANPDRDIMTEIYPNNQERSDKRPDRNLSVRLKENFLKSEQHGDLSIYKYRPLLHINKKEIAEASQMFDDLWKIQTLTRSCDRMKDGQPCKNCYACAEKKWAFGYYDGGSVE